MELKTYFAQDIEGNIIPGAVCTLYLAGTETLATGLKDHNGANLANPFNAGLDGLIAVSVTNGVYDLKVQHGAKSYTIRAQFIDPSDSMDEVAGLVDQAETARDEAVAAASAAVLDPLRRAVEAASGGRMTVLYTANGAPCHMHVFPAFNLEDVAPGGELGTGLHPAFLFDGQPASEIFVGAYQASMMGTEAVSLPMAAPRAAIHFDNARNLCKANGPGWDMMSNLDWAAIALWCMANGYEPLGNTNAGRHHSNKWEAGRRQDGLAPGSSGTAITLTGSGPASWAHDGTPAGIHDLVGNVWEWVTGMKLVDGRAWIAPDNGLNEEDQYIDSGFDLPSNRIWSTVPAGGASNLVKQSLLAPASPALSPAGYQYTTLTGERLPYRGGNWTRAGDAGLAALYLVNDRTFLDSSRGFRLRFRAQ